MDIIECLTSLDESESFIRRLTQDLHSKSHTKDALVSMENTKCLASLAMANLRLSFGDGLRIRKTDKGFHLQGPPL